MAKAFDHKQAKKVLETHGTLLRELSGARAAAGRMRAEIMRASDVLVAREVMNLLKDIPVEELNRNKQGIRVKALRDHGYDTIADVSAAPAASIASVHGISEEGAEAIKRITDDIVATARRGVKIRLSEDDKSKPATEVIMALSRYRRSAEYIEECGALYRANQKNVEDAMARLQSAAGFFKWLVASGKRKQEAAQAYEELRGLLNSRYASQARAALKALRDIQNCTSSEAWQDFSSNSIQFFNLLEEINPGVLGNDDTVYGLPEDLAREIQAQDFFPQGLRCELRRYQEWGVKYALKQKRVLLGDEMGLGKTIQAIAAMVSLRNTGATHFLVVCPASVITNWIREIRKMSLLSAIKIHGAGRMDALRSWIQSGGVAVTTYETTGYIQLEEGFHFSMLVVDEAHYIKNPKAKRSVNVDNICKHAEHLLFMTGTALENKVDEMISLIRMLQPSMVTALRGMEFLSAAAQFREKVAPVYYRRKREDVLTELPELIDVHEWCAMNPEEEKAYETAVLNKKYAEARRVSWNVSDPQRSSKAGRMLEIIEEARAEGRKIIVFSFFLDTVQKVKALLGESCMEPITGSVSPQRRQAIIDEFDQAPAGSVLAAQIQAGGTGLNIQSASVVILCEPQLKPSIENQAISRAYRMGQTRNVLVYRLLCEDSVDEKILSVLERKQAVFDAFADQSVAADESRELDEASFGNIIREEIERIKQKNGGSGVNQPAGALSE